MMDYADELKRIEGVTEPSSSVGMTATIRGACTDNADQVLSRAKSVLSVVVDALATGEEWPDLQSWKTLLPEWFVNACGPEVSPEEAMAWLEKWRALSSEEQSAEEARRAWELEDWLYWFRQGPDERQWCWLRANAVGRSSFQVTLEVTGFPVALGALSWLLRASGALTVEGP